MGPALITRTSANMAKGGKSDDNHQAIAARAGKSVAFSKEGKATVSVIRFSRRHHPARAKLCDSICERPVLFCDAARSIGFLVASGAHINAQLRRVSSRRGRAFSAKENGRKVTAHTQ